MKQGEKSGIVGGMGVGVFLTVMFGTYGLSFWYGSKLIYNGEMEAGDVTTVFFAIIMGAMSIGQLAPILSNFATARGSAVHVFDIIDRKSEIDSMEDEGVQLSELKGKIQIQEVKFTYPSRPEAQVLKGINLDIHEGETIALVGASGCAKSTIISLIQRFYDAEKGNILIDGRNVKEYSIPWLRSRIGVVSQEPVLFAKSIYENIALGNPNASREDIKEAAKKANAHNFIMKLPHGYDTLVREVPSYQEVIFSNFLSVLFFFLWFSYLEDRSNGWLLPEH